MSSVKDFEELAIFQKARELSKKIYPITQKGEFKNDFRFVQQIRAAAGSPPQLSVLGNWIDCHCSRTAGDRKVKRQMNSLGFSMSL